MKPYVRSYLLGSILIAAAFLTLFVDVGLTPGSGRDTNGPWILFIGGLVLALYGSREHRQDLKKNKTGKQ